MIDEAVASDSLEFVSSGIESIQQECTSILPDIVQTSDVTVERRNVGEVE
jgi:hypothetical protein